MDSPDSSELGLADSDPIQRPILRIHIFNERLMRQFAAGDHLHQLGRAIAAAVAVDVVPQPFAEGLELAAGELPVQIGQVGSHLLHELGGVEIAELIGREIAERTLAPVNVLQAAFRIVGRRDAEQGLDRVVPGLESSQDSREISHSSEQAHQNAHQLDLDGLPSHIRAAIVALLRSAGEQKPTG